MLKIPLKMLMLILVLKIPQKIMLWNNCLK